MFLVYCYWRWLKVLVLVSYLMTVVASPSTSSRPPVTESTDEGGGTVGGEEEEDPEWEIRHVLTELVLENNTVTDVHVNVGDVAHLPCRFPQLSTLRQKASLLLTKMWIRARDSHLLAIGIVTYDARFKVLHTEGPDDWTLQIKYAQIKDNGTYECQMHTETGFLSQFVNLNVDPPTATIFGVKELHVQEGDTITLVCLIKQSQPSSVYWHHDSAMGNYDSVRKRLSAVTDADGCETRSTLTITDARRWDSGNYTCLPHNAYPASAIVFVTEGDNNEDGSDMINFIMFCIRVGVLLSLIF